MKKLSIIFILLLSSFSLFAQSQYKRPKIGLVLSGGGAKGTAVRPGFGEWYLPDNG